MSSTTTMPALPNFEFIKELLRSRDRALLRKFSNLGYLLLLRLQSELTALEQQAEKDLVAHIALQTHEAMGTSLSQEDLAKEQSLAEEVSKKLITFYTLKDLFMKEQSAKEPSKATLESFATFFNLCNPGVEIKDSSWSADDMVGPFTSHFQHNLLSKKILDTIYKHRGSKFLKWFVNVLPNCICSRPELPISEQCKNFVSVDPVLMTNRMSSLVVLIAPTLIVAPMFALYAIPSNWGRIAGVWVFSVIFGLATYFLASPKSDFIFPTSAGFCAVLAVFVGTALPSTV